MVRSEHDKFLEGVEALGKGRYKEIAERFVTTRTHQQVRDHAKNHFKKLGEVASSEKYAETKWSAEEHARFLKGLEKYGKGNWKAISDNLVPARTRQQVTSHAVKYFRKIGEPFSDKGYKSAPAKKAPISAPATVKAKAKIRKRKRGAPRGKDRPLSRNWPAESLVALTGRY